MTKPCRESHLHKTLNRTTGSEVLKERTNSSWLDGLNLLLLVPRAMAHNTGSSSDTLNDPLSLMGDQEGQDAACCTTRRQVRQKAVSTSALILLNVCRKPQTIQELRSKGLVEEAWNVRPQPSGDSSHILKSLRRDSSCGTQSSSSEESYNRR